MPIVGYVLVFNSALLAATVLPMSSEITLSAVSVSGNYALSGLWFSATLGNVLGSMLNWWLGRYLLHFQHRRWFPCSIEQLHRAQHYFQRFGVFSLLFSWLPIIGDPLTLIAGFLRVPFLLFVLLVTLGKGMRYAVLLYFLPV